MKLAIASTSKSLIAAARKLSGLVEQMKFTAPVSHVYNPLTYAWKPHEEYLHRFGAGRKRVIFLGMNPGPFGMVQTGIPFGEIATVRDWLEISAPIGRPATEHPKRPILGYDCPRSEVSGRRFWKLQKERFKEPDNFFAEHFVTNYCPLAFMEVTGLNRTPDKLHPSEKNKLLAMCDEHLRQVLEILQPEWLIGIGVFARNQGEAVSANLGIRVGKILHPAPANPAANRHDWGETATKELVALGVWK